MKSLKLLTFHLLCLSVSLTYLSGITQAKNGVKTTLSQTQLSQGDHVIHFADNHLTVNVKNYSLASLLHEIARQSGLTVKCSVPPDERITIQFYRIPLDEGLRKILHQHNFALEFAQQRDEKYHSAVRQPAKLWVFLKGKKPYPVNTVVDKVEQAGTSRNYEVKDLIRLNEKFRKMVINEFGQIGTTRRYESEDVIRLDEKTMEMLFNESRNP